MPPCTMPRIAASMMTIISKINKVRTLKTDPVTAPASKCNIEAYNKLKALESVFDPRSQYVNAKLTVATAESAFSPGDFAPAPRSRSRQYAVAKAAKNKLDLCFVPQTACLLIAGSKYRDCSSQNAAIAS
jgi:hypothetical protein